MKKNWTTVIMLFFSIILQAQNVSIDKNNFKVLNKSKKWCLEFNDNCTENWQSKWFLDGLHATIEHTKEGMNFSSGPEERNDAHHAVLWTKKSFEGDLKIEYSYTRTDEKTKWVNILYIQATGANSYASDITEWNDFRTIPAMRKYYRNMNALHISYAAYQKNNTDLKSDYVRVRRYPILPGGRFSDTEIPPASFETGLFNPGETYKITVIKTHEKLYFKVKGKTHEKLFLWDLTNSEPILEGRIGLRHMYARSARYKDFKIYLKK